MNEFSESDVIVHDMGQFDGRAYRVHNRRVVSLRRTFALLLLSTLAIAPCLGVCTGWTASADAQMACCAGKAADEAMMCCAAGESRQNADSSAPLLVALPPVEPIALKMAMALAPQVHAASVIDSHDPITDDSARYVLLSVFLI